MSAAVRPDCDTFPEDYASAPRDTVWLGHLSTVTQPSRKVVALQVVQEANGAGGLPASGSHGRRRIGLVSCSYKDTEEATAYALYLARDLGLPAIIGPTTSDATNAAFLSIENLQFPTLLMTPSSTSSNLTDIEDAGDHLLWRTAPLDRYQIGKVIPRMRGAGIDNVVVIFTPGDVYSDSYKSVFVQEFGGSVEPLPVPGKRKDAPQEQDEDVIRDVVEEAFRKLSAKSQMSGTSQAAPGQAIVFLSSDEERIGRFLALVAARSSGDDGTTWLYLPPIGAAAEALQGLRYTTTRDVACRVRGFRPVAHLGSAGYGAFISAFGDSPGQLAEADGDPYLAQTYDATWLVLYASAWSQAHEPSGAVTAAGIASGLQNVSNVERGVTLLDLATWKSLPGAFRNATDAINVEGASGALDYDMSDELTPESVEFKLWGLTQSGGDYGAVTLLESESDAKIRDRCQTE